MLQSSVNEQHSDCSTNPAVTLNVFECLRHTCSYIYISLLYHLKCLKSKHKVFYAIHVLTINENFRTFDRFYFLMKRQYCLLPVVAQFPIGFVSISGLKAVNIVGSGHVDILDSWF